MANLVQNVADLLIGFDAPAQAVVKVKARAGGFTEPQ